MLQEIFAILDWFRIAILLHFKKSKALFKEGEIWWCSIGMNVGIETYGKEPKFLRPVLVLKKFDASGFFGIPLTSHRKIGSWYVPITCGGIHGSAMLNQARIFDAKRLVIRMGALGDEHFKSIKQIFHDFHAL